MNGRTRLLGAALLILAPVVACDMPRDDRVERAQEARDRAAEAQRELQRHEQEAQQQLREGAQEAREELREDQREALRDRAEGAAEARSIERGDNLIEREVEGARAREAVDESFERIDEQRPEN